MNPSVSEPHEVSGSHRGQCRYSTAPSLQNGLWHRVVNTIQTQQSMAINLDEADLLMDTLHINVFITHTRKNLTGFFPLLPPIIYFR